MNELHLIEKTFGTIFSDNLINELAKNGRVVTVEAGESIISRNDTVKEVPIILTGTAKIVRTDEKAKSIFYFT